MSAARGILPGRGLSQKDPGGHGGDGEKDDSRQHRLAGRPSARGRFGLAQEAGIDAGDLPLQRGQVVLQGGQVGGQGLRVGVAVGGILLQAAVDDPDQRLGHERVRVAGVRGGFVPVLDGHRERRLAFEGDLPGDHLEQDDPDRVEVGAGIHLAQLDLLGGHVLGRAEHDARPGDAVGLQEAGQSEVHDPGPPVVVDHDVLGLEVAVDDPDPVGFGQAFRHLAGDGRGPAGPDGPGPPDELLEVLALDVFHGQEVDQSGFAQVVEPADVAVGDLAGVLELVLEALDGRGVEPDLGLDDLEGHDLLQLLVEGLIDRAHAAFAQLLDDLVAAGEQGAPDQVVEGGDQGLAFRRGGGREGRQRSGALAAKAAVAAVFGAADGASHGGSFRSPRDIMRLRGCQTLSVHLIL